MGHISWHDLTVKDAEKVSDFYCEVLGWEKEGLDMGGYDDYVMKEPREGDGVAGVCHAKGVNADLPPMWLPYVIVDDLDKSLERCTALGGKILTEKRKMGPDGYYCLIQDPAGAYMMICG